MSPIRAVVAAVLFCIAPVEAAERDPQVKVLEPGVKLSIAAEHPDLATPTGIDVDAEGRVWVVATHTHFRPENYVGPEHDEVIVFSDADGDGAMEQRRVFYNATVATMDLELGADGWVYLAERDRILRIKDSDGDGEADLVEDLAVLNTEADYPHNGLEGLAWHPSGDLLFALGENYAKPWTLRGVDGKTVAGTGEGGIFRCTADGKKLRRIARGFWNPFGLCVRADGAIFAAENDPGERPPCRLLHIVEGGDYGYQRSYGPEAHHPFVCWNGQLRGTLPMLHPSGEAPCGVLPLGRGLLVPSWSDHRLDFFALRQKGASYSADRIQLVHGSRYFRPGCIASNHRAVANSANARQAWYFTDWVDGRYQAHGYGRLWKLEIDLKEAKWIGKLELEPPNAATRLAARIRKGDLDANHKRLFELSRSEDPFLARAALVALSRQAATWTRDEVAKWPAANRVQAVMALKLAEAEPRQWIEPLLRDEDSDVQFETLRWMADERLTEYLKIVGEYLNRSDLDFRRFEAAVATWNTLNGKPESGVRNPAMLLARVRDAKSAPRVRAFALRLLPTLPRKAPKGGAATVLNFPKGLTLKLLEQLLKVDDEDLTREVVRTLATNPIASQKLLLAVATDSQQRESLRAEAIAGLAVLAEQHLELLMRLAEAEQRAVREEALRALRLTKRSNEQNRRLAALARKHSDSADLVAALLHPNSLAQGRPAPSDTDAWLEALAAIDQPADPESGRRIFHHSRAALCSNCHRHSGRGNVVGPDLSNLARRDDRRWLLQSLLEPSRQMAPEFQPRTVVLKDGRTFTGIRLRSSTSEAMRDANGQNQSFNRNDIESMKELSTSFMPKGLVDSLTLRELRDLIAFLESNR